MRHLFFVQPRVGLSLGTLVYPPLLSPKSIHLMEHTVWLLAEPSSKRLIALLDKARNVMLGLPQRIY